VATELKTCCISILIYPSSRAWYAGQARYLLLVLEHIDQRSNVGRDLYRKLVASLQSLFGRLTHAYSGGCTGNDDRSCGQSRALGEEADKLRDAKDEVAVGSVSYIGQIVWMMRILHTLAGSLAGLFHSSSRGCEAQMDPE
jgi:hypothetical protein